MSLTPLQPPASLSPRDIAAIAAYAAKIAAAAPPPTLELIARLRPILCAPLEAEAEPRLTA